MIDGATFARMLAAAATALDVRREALNAINVYPVPDGDTGNNLAATMRPAADAALAAGGRFGDVAAAAAEASLMAARGNSGVLLSQILGGFRRHDGAVLDARGLARCLAAGRDAAYRSMSEPREGTILSAISAAASAAGAAGGASIDEALAAVVEATREAVARTPEQLPVLAEAGVVDAGAQGLLVIFEAMLRCLRGEPDEDPPAYGTISAEWLASRGRAHASAADGYCIEFVVATGDAEGLRDAMRALGDSVLVARDERLTRVHLHARDYAGAIERARAFGEVSHVKVDDMAAQFAAVSGASGAQGGAGAPSFGDLAVVAVAAGEGMQRLMRSLGAIVVPGGQTMNPSVAELAAAIDAAGAPRVAVLPDNPNVILTARQAARGRPGVDVIETKTMQEGVAALAACVPDAAPEENIAAMREAAAGVRTAQVTYAARDSSAGGLRVRAGQPIGIVEGELVVAADTVSEAVLACIDRLAAGGGVSLVTIYTGAEARAAEVAEIRARAPRGISIEVIEGGQPHYPYLLAAE